MGIFDFAGSLINAYRKNKDIINPIVETGLEYSRMGDKADARSDALNYIRGQEDAKYRDAMANYEAERAYAERAGAASRANAAAQAAAARQTQAAQQAALRKAYEMEKRSNVEARAHLMPYISAGAEVLPAATATYKGGLDTLGLLNAYLTNPQQMARLNQSVPAWAANPALFESLRKRDA